MQLERPFLPTSPTGPDSQSCGFRSTGRLPLAWTWHFHKEAFSGVTPGEVLKQKRRTEQMLSAGAAGRLVCELEVLVEPQGNTGTLGGGRTLIQG